VANEHQIIIKGHVVKELRCKNDECRALIGYDNIILGLFIYSCPKCGTLSIFKMQYRAMGKEFIKELRKRFKNENQLKGGNVK